MTETTTSAIVMVTSVLIACIMIGIFIVSYKGIGSVNEVSETRQEEMDVKNDDNNLEQYVGSTIDGYKLQSLLKSLAANSDVTVEINNMYIGKTGGSIYEYSFTETFNFSVAGKKEAQSSGKAFVTTYDTTGKPVTLVKGYTDFYTLEDDEKNSVSGYAEEEPVSKMILNPERPDWYIDPFGKFYCSAESSGGAVKKLIFTRKE